MKKILISWIGQTDLRAVAESDNIGLGPIAQAVQAIPFFHAVLISDYPLPYAGDGCRALSGRSLLSLGSSDITDSTSEGTSRRYWTVDRSLPCRGGRWREEFEQENFSIRKESSKSPLARHYLQRGMDEGGANKSKAAKLLGLPNYQTLTNWLKKYGLE